MSGLSQTYDQMTRKMYASHIQGIYQVYIKVCMRCQPTLLHVIKHFQKQSVYSIEVHSNTLIHLANPSLLLQLVILPSAGYHPVAAAGRSDQSWK